LLMLAPSRSCWPRLLVSDARSAPARSTSASLPVYKVANNSHKSLVKLPTATTNRLIM